MDTAESQAYSMNIGADYANQPNMHPADGSQGVPGLTSMPAVGSTVKHAKSGELGRVTGEVRHGHSSEALPTVRWAGQAASGFTSDQGYSLDSLTNP